MNAILLSLLAGIWSADVLCWIGCSNTGWNWFIDWIRCLSNGFAMEPLADSLVLRKLIRLWWGDRPLSASGLESKLDRVDWVNIESEKQQQFNKILNITHGGLDTLEAFWFCSYQAVSSHVYVWGNLLNIC